MYKTTTEKTAEFTGSITFAGNRWMVGIPSKEQKFFGIPKKKGKLCRVKIEWYEKDEEFDEVIVDDEV